MLKIVKWVVLVVVLLVIIGGVIVYLSLDSIIKSEVQTQATNSLNLKTTLGSASLSLFGGKLNLSNLDIGSPAGFAAPHMFALNGVDVDVHYGQLRDDPIHIAGIRITNPQLVIEQANGKINVKSAMDQMPKTEEKPSTTGKREEGKPIKLVIDDLTVSNTSVTIKPGNLPGLGAVKDYTLNIPTVDLKNVGSGNGNQNGAAIKDVVMLVMTKLVQEAGNSDQLPPELKALLHLNADQLVAQIKDQLGAQLGNAVQQVQQKIGGEMGSAVGDVLKNPKQATSNPSQLLQEGLDAFGKKKSK